ncbi:zinc finger E-box-binding homeobox 2-like isoform X1 [Branchiostoma lanceolatum]
MDLPRVGSSMAEVSRCTRRKQACPRRKKAEYEEEEDEGAVLDDADASSTTHMSDSGVVDDNEPDQRLDDSLHMENGTPVQSPAGDDISTTPSTPGTPDHSNPPTPGTPHRTDELAGDGSQAEHDIREYVNRSDTAIVYPESADDPMVGHAPTNGTGNLLEDQLLSCPYCDRGYKRLTSLKEHIKYRHERTDSSYACNECNYTFAYKSQLERHMASHKPGRDQVCERCNKAFVNIYRLQRHMLTHSSGNRKFKCHECGKAFKYKHHLKEHLRIHSGEKPYECPNCHKRFSHSGSYSSHISSKKCIGLLSFRNKMAAEMPPNVVPTSMHLLMAQAANPTVSLPNGSSNPATNGLHAASTGLLQAQLNLTLPSLLAATPPLGATSTIPPPVMVKTEPLDTLSPPMSSRSSISPSSSGVYVSSSGSSTESPVKGDINQVKKVLQIVENTVTRQQKETGAMPDTRPRAVESAAGNLSDELSKIRENAKAMSLATEALSLSDAARLPLNLNGFHAGDPTSASNYILKYTLEKFNQAKALQAFLPRERSFTPGKEMKDYTCRYCGEAFPGAIPLHQHERYLCKQNEEILAAAQLQKNAQLAEASLMEQARSFKPDLLDLQGQFLTSSLEKAKSELDLSSEHLTVLKAYYALHAQPSPEELVKISSVVGLPKDFVESWFANMRERNEPSGGDDKTGDPDGTAGSEVEVLNLSAKATAPSTLPGENSEPSEAEIPRTQSPCVKEEEGQPQSDGDAPMDLTLPKTEASKPKPNSVVTIYNKRKSAMFAPMPDPLLSNPAAYYAALPFFGQGGIPAPFPGYIDFLASPMTGAFLNGLGSPYLTPGFNAATLSAKRPRLDTPTPTRGRRGRRRVYDNGGGRVPMATQSVTPVQTPSPMHPSMDPDTQSPLALAQETAEGSPSIPSPSPSGTYPGYIGDSASSPGSPALSTGTPGRRRDRTTRTEDGLYACDLCDKVFQKHSSLLRHKYEHTGETNSGKRPHQCPICQKAFKHKHHLIEHSRLHSGEKPYQCDKCLKRFSHSGSYSQHMNHRYSYCKKDD